jgi:hypothetical protein
MMRTRLSATLRIAAFAAATLLAGCESQPKVGSDFNPQYDFASRSKFAVMRPDVAQGGNTARTAVAVPNDLLAQRLTMAIEGALIARGFTVVPPEQADMIVTFFVTTQNQVDVRTYNAGFGYGACWSPYRCAMYANPQVDVRNYKEGTLYVDFIDKATRKLQWRGVTSDRLPNNPTREKRDQIVRDAVGAIIAQYPM